MESQAKEIQQKLPRSQQPQRKAYMAAYREKNKERIAAQKANYDKVYREQNKEKIAVSLKKTRKKNKEKYQQTAKEYAQANKEKLKKYISDYYQANRDKLIKRAADHAANNPEATAQRKRDWINANPELKRIYSHNRRARERENGGKLSKDLAERLYGLQKGKCRCCGKKLGKKGDGYHIDHIIPIAKGGPNIDSNCQLLCKPCNLSKAAKDPHEHAMAMGRLFI